ncbi:hypothetical protein [Enterobacter cloacae complex sp. GF14B]|uniref:hypothetical protein n=1 Tax=Enterobacter cloacae complex sp. GF14B TaxID=2511982 RepID=UPI00100EC7FC|nr:hypothetical protein [Enterobacter cloacae complex sp. GF14B]
MKTTTQEFDSVSSTKTKLPSWLNKDTPIWMSGALENGSLRREKCILERDYTDEAYITEPFTEHLFEPFEWAQILATMDVCVNTNDLNPSH